MPLAQVFYAHGNCDGDIDIDSHYSDRQAAQWYQS